MTLVLVIYALYGELPPAPPRARHHRGVNGTELLVHLDTDIGENPDDLAALALLLASPEARLTGVTTAGDASGRRAALVQHVLALAGRSVPVAGDRAAAVDLLHAAATAGATLLAVGPLTNLARLERSHPGALGSARLVTMGGWVGADRPAPVHGQPDWGPWRDTNVVRDPAAATRVFAAAGSLTLVTLAETARCVLHWDALPRLRGAGAVGQLLAEHIEAYAGGAADADEGGRGDVVLLLHDPLAAAVALGWPGAATTRTRGRFRPDSGGLRLEPDPAGREVRLVTGLDGGALAAWWLDRVTVLP